MELNKIYTKMKNNRKQFEHFNTKIQPQSFIYHFLNIL